MWTCLALCTITLRRSLQLSGELAGRFGSLGLWRRPARTPVASEATAGALVVAVSSGLSLRGSLELVADILDAPARAELAAVLRDAHRIGLSAALARATGDLAPLFGRVARATMSGAPISASIAGYLAEERGLRRATRLEAARRLPVRLTIPLALLILPGFVLLAAGPAVLHSFEAMLRPLMP